MDSNQPLEDERIEAAILAYNDLTPDSLTAFRALSDIEAVVVIRVLRATNPVKPARSKRKDAGVTRGSRAETKG